MEYLGQRHGIFVIINGIKFKEPWKWTAKEQKANIAQYSFLADHFAKAPKASSDQE